MSLAALDTPQVGRVIASRSRATALAETVADKHALNMRTMLCARWDRFAIAARAELASELKAKLGWSQRRIGEYLGCTQPNVRKLFSYHELNARRARRWLPQTDVHALLAVDADDRLARALDAEERAAEAEAELRRLSGADLTIRLGDAIELGGAHGGRSGGVVLLAILVETYPNLVAGPALLQLYDEACERLGFGRGAGAGYHLMSKNASNLTKHFRDKGWPAPTELGDMPASRRLTHDAAQFLHERIGSPRLSQMEAAREQRSNHVHASAVR